MPGLQTAFAQGLAANRPAASASNAGFFWLSTDSNGGTLYQSTGSAWVQLAAGVNPPASAITAGTLAAARGGTGLDASAAANGALLIGNGTGLSLATLTAGSNVTITNSAGGISIASSAGGGAASFSWVTKTANYTITTSDTGILADATSGAITMTLPTAVGSTARYQIKKKDASANAVSIATTSSQTIDGASSLALGGQNDSLEVESDGANWFVVGRAAKVPAVRAYNSANISTTSGAYSYLTFDSNRFDQGTGTAQHSTSSNTSRLVCQVAGVYQISGDVQFAGSNGGTQRATQIRLNGTTAIAQHFASPQSTNTVSIALSTLYLLAAGDYLELGAYQDSGGALNVLAGGNHSPEFMMARLG